MTLNDLLKDADKAGDAAGIFQVLLATRTIDGREMEPGQVQLSGVGVLQVDPSTEEIDVLPTGLMDPKGVRMTIADVRRKLQEQPECGDFTLAGVVGVKKLTDGTVQLIHPIIGTYTVGSDQEMWLLLHPEKQWPEHWFAPQHGD